MTIVVIAFFTGIILLYYSMLINEKRSNIIKSGEMTAKESAEKIDQYLSTNIDSVDLAAYTLDEMITDHCSDDEMRDYIVELSTAVRSAVWENSTGLYGYINGKFISGTNWEPPEGYDATVRPWYIKPMEHPGEMTVLDPYHDIQSGHTMLALGKTLCDGVSVISVDVSLDRIQELAEDAVKNGDSDIEMVLNDKGVVIAHSDKSEIGKDYKEEKKTLGAEVIKRLDKTEEHSFEFSFKGARYIVYEAFLQNGWSCISVKDATTIFGSINWIFLITIAAVTAIVLIISIIMTRSNSYLQMSAKARASSDAKSAFLSQMSHEIRTPINAMLGMNEMILRESDDPAIRSYSEKARTAGRHLLDMVNDILDFSTSEDGGIDTGETDFETFFNEEVVVPEEYRGKFTAEDARILVVDDNAMNIVVFKSLVGPTRVNIDTAESGKEAIALTLDNKYDMIFLDHMMPEKDGIETLHEIRGDLGNPNQGTPAICLTANAISGAREQYLSAGFDDYLTKPVDPGRLEDLMLKYLADEKIRAGQESGEEGRKEEDENAPDDMPELESLVNAGVDTKKGLKNSGSKEAYLLLLKMFYETIDERTDELNGFCSEDDVKNYTIKIHALKSSARIIGAAGLGERAQKLENAGKAGDMDYIRRENDGFIEEFQALREPLSVLFASSYNKDDRPEADETVVKDMLGRLLQAAHDMDCDRLDDIILVLEDYRMPESYAGLYAKVKESVGRYDYKTLVALLSHEAEG